ncbi:hypothetical protein [Carnobacterium pleistocenium]|nr:hypothetical protein [Carnobacterium pleistocenium]
MIDSIIITKNGDKFEVSIKQGKQSRWFTIDEEEAKELINKLTKEIGVK